MKLYHYTDIKAFKSIIETGDLWGFHYRYMNDSQEYHWVLKLTEEYIDEIQKQDKSKLSLYFAEVHSYLKSRQGLVTPYIISFADRGDDLNQWRSYGNDGFGVCLEFNRNEDVREISVEDLLERGEVNIEKGIYLKTGHWEFMKVLYIDPKMENPIKSFIEVTFNWFSDKYNGVDVLDGAMMRDLDIIAYYLWIVSTGVKHIAFKSENEYRAILSAEVNMKDFQYEEKFLKNNIYFHSTESGIRSYCKLQIEDYGGLGNIYLGPKYDGHLWDVSDFLRKNEYNGIEIIKSDLPYK